MEEITNNLVQSTEARVNVTYSGQNGDLPDPVARASGT